VTIDGVERRIFAEDLAVEAGKVGRGTLGTGRWCAGGLEPPQWALQTMSPLSCLSKG
jgi:hypothetical protein